MNSDDLNFAYKVRHALNEHADHLPSSTVDRLASARKAALARKRPDLPSLVAERKLAGNLGSFLSFSFLGSMAYMIPLIALVAGLAGIYQVEKRQRIAELAELDAAVLSDELPLTAYLDTGFHAYLEQQKRAQ